MDPIRRLCMIAKQYTNECTVLSFRVRRLRFFFLLLTFLEFIWADCVYFIITAAVGGGATNNNNNHAGDPLPIPLLPSRNNNKKYY